MVAVLQQGLESIRVVNAFGTQNEEETRLKKISLETVHAALKTRKLKALVSPVVSIVVTALPRSCVMERLLACSRWRNDGRCSDSDSFLFK